MKKIKNRIFVDKKINSNDQIILDANQIHYLKSVLRTKKSDYVTVFNREFLCLTKVINITKNTCELEIIDQKKIESEDHNSIFFSYKTYTSRNHDTKVLRNWNFNFSTSNYGKN